jgi:AraC family transcriptional regulator
MDVEWREVRAGCEMLLPGERIGVLVPLEGAALRATLPDSAGRPREVVFAEPEVAVVPSQGRQSLVAERGGMVLVIELDPGAWTEQSQAAFGHAREIRESHVAADPFVRGLASFLRAKLRGGAVPAREWLDTVCEDLGLHLATRYGRPPESAGYSGLAPHRLQRVLGIIDQRLAEPIQVRELADAVHMSPYHFARMFKQSTGHPPHLYITWQRMDRAKQLLAQSALPLAEVATRVGYQTQAHFTGVFHTRVGMTPRAYRVRCRNAQGVDGAEDDAAARDEAAGSA